MKWAILVTFVLIAGLATGVFIYVGGYKPVETEIGDAGPYRLLYKKHLGPYHEIVKTLTDVETWAHAHDEKCELTFGEYLDNPKLVAEDRLESNGGCIVEKTFSKDLPEGFAFREIPKREYLMATFDGAPSIGPLKVYPKADKIMRHEGLQADGAVIEVYEVLSSKAVKTRYYFPVSKVAHP